MKTRNDAAVGIGSAQMSLSHELRHVAGCSLNYITVQGLGSEEFVMK